MIFNSKIKNNSQAKTLRGFRTQLGLNYPQLKTLSEFQKYFF
jgi:hypothetical protein